MALAAGIIWEVRTTGNAQNGGAFNPAGSGVDYSQQNAAQYALTGVTSGGAGNTVLTASAAADMVGNTIQVISGTNFTTGFFEITSVSVGVSITCSTNNAGASISTGIGASGVMNIGGALTTMLQPDVIAGNQVYVKATATYTITATQTFSVAGTAGNPITFIGYTTIRGDNGQVTVQRSSGNTTQFSITGSFQRFINFIGDGNSAGTQTGWAVNATQTFLYNCQAKNFTSQGFNLGNSGSANVTIVNCRCTGGTSAATAGFNITTLASQRLLFCIADTNACPGFRVATTSAGSVMMFHCISANNTNSADGFICNNVAGMTMINCVSYSNAGNGLLLDSATTATAGNLVAVYNSVFYGNGVFGINSNATNYNASGSFQLPMNYNAFGGNSSGDRQNVPTGANDVSLSGDPFTNGASLDFSTNNTAGQGAALRAAGFPGVLQVGGTGYLDIGTLQHQDSGGGTTAYIFPVFD